MQDQPENRDSRERRGGPRRLNGSAESPNHERKFVASTPSQGKQPPKRKGPVVNRRGPTEVDRAIKMNQMATRPSTGRKVAEGTVSRGTVVRIDRAKGYGFLVDGAGEQRFFHRSAVLDGGFATLREQQTVEFEAHGDERGARALKVRPVGSSPASSRAGQASAPSPKTANPTGWRSSLMPFRSGSTPSTTPGRRI
ncbi:MAG: cold-shock protein [Sphingomonadaceae bacterium]